MTKPQKLPSGSYRVQVYNKYTGKRKSFTAPTERKAKAMARQYESEISPDEGEDCTIADAISKYIDNRSSVLSPSTLSGYRKYVKAGTYASVENLRVESITSEQIQRFVNDFSITHQPKYVRNVYALLISSILAVKPHKRINVTLPAKKPVERHIPTDNDIQELLRICDKQYLRIAIMLAAIGTVRRGEACALQYEDITGTMIHVHADMVLNSEGEWEYKSMPKNATSDRYIEFPAQVIKEIGKGEGFILGVVPATITNNFIKLRDKLHLECRFHDLRSYAASIMHAIGIPDQYIQERGGWKSDVVLKSVYRNALSDKSKEFSDRTNDYMQKFFG